MPSSKLDSILSFLSENPKDPFLKYALGKEYEKLGQLEKTTELFENLIQSDPDYIGTYYHLGKIYERQSAPEKAVAIYQSGILVARKIGDKHAEGELAGAKMMIEDEE